MRFTFKRFALLSGRCARAVAGLVGLTQQRVDLLLSIRFGELSQKQIGSELGVTQPVISRMIGALLKLQMVQRRRSERDRRVWLVSVAPAGDQALETLFDGWLVETEEQTLQSSAEEWVMDDWKWLLEKHAVATNMLSDADQRCLLEKMQPIIWGTLYPGHNLWLLGDPPYHWDLIEQQKLLRRLA